MSFIEKSNKMGLNALYELFPTFSEPLQNLMNTVMCNPNSSLSKYELETIALFISERNECRYSTNYHAKISNKYEILENYNVKANAQKMNKLLDIAETVRTNPFNTSLFFNGALELGITKQELQETVLVSSIICMFNKYILAMGVDTDSLEHKNE